MKSTFSYIFNLFFSILLFAVTVFAGILLVENASRVQKVNSSPSIKIKNTNTVEKILSAIRDEKVDLAFEEFNQFILENQNIESDSKILEYFQTFKDEVQKMNVKNVSVNTLYFINNSYAVENYLQDLGYNRFSAERFSQIVPYYFIKNYNQNKKSQGDVYHQYIRHYSQNDSISESTADVICLYFQTLYKENSWTGLQGDDFIKSQIIEIQKYQQKFKRELSPDGGEYSKQASYLKNLYSFLSRVANKKFNWLKLESCPKYVIGE